MPLTTSSGKAPFLRCRRSRERRRATALLLAVLRQAVSQVAGDAQSCANGSAHGGTDGLHPHERLVASRSVQACRSRPSQPWRTSSPMVCESSSGGVTSASRGSARASSGQCSRPRRAARQLSASRSDRATSARSTSASSPSRVAGEPVSRPRLTDPNDDPDAKDRRSVEDPGRCCGCTTSPRPTYVRGSTIPTSEGCICTAASYVSSRSSWISDEDGWIGLSNLEGGRVRAVRVHQRPRTSTL